MLDSKGARNRHYKKILESSGKVVIHVSGGIGKPIVATRLPGLMSKGSACVVLDGFAGGEYTLERSILIEEIHCKVLSVNH
jgi:hypothetical protein